MSEVDNEEVFDPQVGDIVCDCRYRHLRIKSRVGDDVILEDGSSMSVYHCLAPAADGHVHPDGF